MTLDRYADELNGRLGAEPVVEFVTPRVAEDGIVAGLVYRDVPEPGYVSGFAYGLSPERELTITVRSADLRWGMVPAGMVAALRGIRPFNPGEVLGYVRPYVDRSLMNSAVLAAPALPGPVGLVGVYPLYASERDEIRRRGFDSFWALDWDRFDPSRPPVA